MVARVAELAHAGDLKSPAFGYAGSNPAPGIGELAERSKALALKASERQLRGFESLALRLGS